MPYEMDEKPKVLDVVLIITIILVVIAVCHIGWMYWSAGQVEHVGDYIIN